VEWKGSVNKVTDYWLGGCGYFLESFAAQVTEHNNFSFSIMCTKLAVPFGKTDDPIRNITITSSFFDIISLYVCKTSKRK
jgi:hypothetical protein